MSERVLWGQRQRRPREPRRSLEELVAWHVAPYDDEEQRRWVEREVRQWGRRREQAEG